VLYSAFNHYAPAEHGNVAVYRPANIYRAIEARNVASSLPFLDGNIVAELYTVFVRLLGERGGREDKRNDEGGERDADSSARSCGHSVSLSIRRPARKSSVLASLEGEG